MEAKPSTKPSKSGSPGKLDRLVEEYANVVGRFGPDSPQALKIRTENATNAEFLKFAQSIDRLKRAVEGRVEDVKRRSTDEDVSPEAPMGRETRCPTCGSMVNPALLTKKDAERAPQPAQTYGFPFGQDRQ